MTQNIASPGSNLDNIQVWQNLSFLLIFFFIIWKCSFVSNLNGFDIFIDKTWIKHTAFQLQIYFEIVRLIIMHLILVLNFVHCIGRNFLWNGIGEILTLLMRIEWWRIVSSSATDAFFFLHTIFKQTTDFCQKKAEKAFGPIGCKMNVKFYRFITIW